MATEPSGHRLSLGSRHSEWLAWFDGASGGVEAVVVEFAWRFRNNAVSARSMQERLIACHGDNCRNAEYLFRLSWSCGEMSGTKDRPPDEPASAKFDIAGRRFEVSP